MLLAITAASIVLLLTIFYTLLTVSLFVPILAGLFVQRTTALSELAVIRSLLAKFCNQS